MHGCVPDFLGPSALIISAHRGWTKVFVSIPLLGSTAMYLVSNGVREHYSEHLASHLAGAIGSLKADPVIRQAARGRWFEPRL